MMKNFINEVEGKPIGKSKMKLFIERMKNPEDSSL